MTSGDGDLLREMEELRAAFAAELPSRVAAIGVRCHALLRGDLDPAQTSALVRDVHSLAGSGTTFGRPDVSRAAGRVEDVLEALAAGTGPADDLPDALGSLEAAARAS